jgi:hypothetical protein
MICRLHHFFDQVLYTLNFGTVCWNGDCFRAGGKVGLSSY